MKRVDSDRTKPIPDTHALVGRLGLVFLAMLLASCGGSADAPQQPASPPGDDASLSSLTISDGTLDPVFTPTDTDYAASVPHNTDNVDVYVTASDIDADITINGGVDIGQGCHS